jgi:protein O-mannosyl-transferase
VSDNRRAAFGTRNAIVIAALFAAVLLVYQPAWNGAFLWDDRAHLTARELRSWHGLWRIWSELGATQQYYPLTHSAFWLQQRLWGEAPLGYHLVNIILHFGSAVLVFLILRKLAVPGSSLAAAVFALHPVQVESVAWISELKNTLSAVLYLGAALAWLRFEEDRRAMRYVLALTLFVLALCSKTVTATLPAALLLIDWWRRGDLAWRRDAIPLLPFFALGGAAGLFTVWVEHHFTGAEGAAFDFTLADRVLIAGRALCFYVAKLFWPANLTFIYPRWHVSHRVIGQYAYPLAALVAFAAAWIARRHERGVLAGMLFFAGTLFPALGFFDVYPFLFSFVADHFQYLASLGVIALATAAGATLLERSRLQVRGAPIALSMAVLAPLAFLTWRQTGLYRDSETLYRATIRNNPDCWMAWNNLARSLIVRGELDEGIRHARHALELRPDYPEARTNLGIALAMRGQLVGAAAELEQALRDDPTDAAIHYHLAVVHNDLGVALAAHGNVDEALTHFRRAIEVDPAYVDAHNNLGIVLARSGRTEEAIAQFRAALEIEPARAEVRRNLDVALARRQRPQ